MRTRLVNLWQSRWGAALVVVLLVMVYQWWVSPLLMDVRNDLAFLHAARMQAMQQAQQHPK